MMMSIRAQTLFYTGALILPLACATPARALTVNVSGIDYDVFYASTSYDANPALFSATPPGQMPWWGDAILASTFATEVYDQLGDNLHQSGYGAVFAYDFSPGNSGEVNGIIQNTSDINDQLDLDASSPLAANTSFPYAYATLTSPVPAPLPLLGVSAAFGWARRIRNSRKLIKANTSSMNSEPN